MTRRQLRNAAPFGGELELTALPTPFSTLTLLAEKDAVPVATGRTAVFLAARAVRLHRSGPALVPSYVCDSVVQALRQAGVGVRYYPVDESLRINVATLVELAKAARPGLIVVVNYFGFPTPHEVFDALEKLPHHPLLVEDCAHGSWLEHPGASVGGRGDMVFTSFRKYLPVPDGGLLLNRSKLPLPPLLPTQAEFVRWRLTGKLLRGLGRDLPLTPDAEQVYLDLFAAAERELDARVPVAAMSALSSAIVSAANLRQVMARRRANFRELLGASRGRVLGRVLEPIYRVLPAGVSPLVFPVRVARGTRDALRRRLHEARVYCPVHWPLPASVNRSRFPESARLAAQMIGIPLDQRYDASAMKELIDRLTFVCREFA